MFIKLTHSPSGDELYMRAEAVIAFGVGLEPDETEIYATDGGGICYKVKETTQEVLSLLMLDEIARTEQANKRQSI